MMTINWITIQVADFEKSKEFYSDYLGMKVEKEFSPNELMSIVFFEADNGMKIELIYSMDSKEELTNNGISFGVCVSNYDELLQKARERKIITSEPAIMGGHMECFFVNDPNGVGVQIIKG